MRGFDGYADYIEVDAKWKKHSKSVELLRRNQQRLSFAAFTLFAAGYFEIVWVMIHMQAVAQAHS